MISIACFWNPYFQAFKLPYIFPLLYRMAAKHSFAEFDPSLEDWNSYSERFDFYLEAGRIEDPAIQLSTFLSSVGPSTYKLIRNLCCPKPPRAMTYKEIKELLQHHFRPKPSVAVERLKFHSTVRQPSESLTSYIARLRELSEFCEFTNLDEMLRDRLVCGINNPRIQKLLLTESSDKLTFKRAQELAESAEAAEKSIHDVTSTTGNPHINVLSQRLRKAPHNPKRQDQPLPTVRNSCYRCGGKHHHTRCQFKDATCHYCHNKGHLIRVCRKRQNKEKKSFFQQTNVIENCHSNLGRSVAQQEQSVSSVLIPDSYPDTLYTVTSKNHIGPLHVQLTVDGKPISMQVDTGAAASLISQVTYSSLWDTPPPLTKSNTSLITYTGEQVSILGTLMTRALYKEQSHRLPLYVVKGNGPSLLGRDWLNFFRLDWKEICTLHQPSKLDRILKKYAQVFEPSLGTFHGVSVDIETYPQATPKFFKARSVPFVYREN